MKWLLILTGLIVLLLILVPLFMILVGYKVNNDSGEVAEIAAREGNIELCDKIINYGIFGPPSDESRMHCVYRYASLTKDPSACDLLMPSSYGWSCLGAARKKGEICSINYNKYYLSL
ncbi:hypothetical protein KJ680_00700 [bacterium]|nr:hypothetical protein [bacterium]